MAKKPAKPDHTTHTPATARMSDDHLNKFFQCLGTTDVPENVDDVHRVVHGLLKLWKDKPEILGNIPSREKGIRFSTNMLARYNSVGLQIAEKTIDALGTEAPNSLRGTPGFAEVMTMLDDALPEVDFERYREAEDNDAGGVAALA